MRPRAVFFDMDDTLLDTSGGVEDAWKGTLAEFTRGLGADPESLRAAIKRESMTFWKDEAAVRHWRLDLHGARVHVTGLALAGEGLDPSQAELVATRYFDEIALRWRLFDDAIETLEWLRARGHRLALITNGPADMQQAKIDRFLLAPYFETIVIEGAFGYGKPDVEVFAHALTATGASAAEAWHVGDNLYADISGARGMGLHAVWIHRDRLEIEEAPIAVPDRVIANLADLRNAIEAL